METNNYTIRGGVDNVLFDATANSRIILWMDAPVFK
jgi:hypothetical protein